jgi:hypothetical protein
LLPQIVAGAKFHIVSLFAFLLPLSQSHLFALADINGSKFPSWPHFCFSSPRGIQGYIPIFLAMTSVI